VRILETFTKAPGATSLLDYTLRWTKWLPPGGRITAATWVVTGADLSSTPPPSFTDDTTTAWISGGVADTVAYATCYVTASTGQMDPRTIEIQIRE
jgi:acyl dehydratase